MFSKFYTRLLLVLFLIITPVVSYLALNWNVEPEGEREVKHLLEVPRVEDPGLRRRSVDQPEPEPEEDIREIEIDKEEEEDTGRTIDLF